MSHAGFLRDETDGDAEPGVIALVRALHAAGEEAAKHPLLEGVGLVHEAIDALGPDALAVLEPEDIPLLHYVAETTLAPRAGNRDQVASLRRAGFDDVAIHDIVHVVCCFSYMNRLADALGVEVAAADRQGWAERLFGAEALAAHHAWADKELPTGDRPA